MAMRSAVLGFGLAACLGSCETILVKIRHQDAAEHIAELQRSAIGGRRVDCDRLGVPLGPELLALRPEDADDAPMACGGGGDLLQIGGRPGPGAPNAE